MKTFKKITVVLTVVISLTLISMTMDKTPNSEAYLQITLKVDPENRQAAAGVYVKYKTPFLKQIKGAVSKNLLIRNDDVQVLHGFTSEENAKAYLSTALFAQDIVSELKPYLTAAPEIKIYSVFGK